MPDLRQTLALLEGWRYQRTYFSSATNRDTALGALAGGASYKLLDSLVPGWVTALNVRVNNQDARVVVVTDDLTQDLTPREMYTLGLVDPLSSPLYLSVYDTVLTLFTVSLSPLFPLAFKRGFQLSIANPATRGDGTANGTVTVSEYLVDRIDLSDMAAFRSSIWGLLAPLAAPAPGALAAAAPARGEPATPPTPSPPTGVPFAFPARETPWVAAVPSSEEVPAAIPCPPDTSPGEEEPALTPSYPR